MHVVVACVSITVSSSSTLGVTETGHLIAFSAEPLLIEATTLYSGYSLSSCLGLGFAAPISYALILPKSRVMSSILLAVTTEGRLLRNSRYPSLPSINLKHITSGDLSIRISLYATRPAARLSSVTMSVGYPNTLPIAFKQRRVTLYRLNIAGYSCLSATSVSAPSVACSTFGPIRSLKAFIVTLILVP